MSYIVIGNAGQIIENDNAPSLSRMQEMVSVGVPQKGLLDMLILSGSLKTGGLHMWTHAEGPVAHPTNFLATYLLKYLSVHPGPVWGPAIITGFDKQGDMVGLTDEQHAHVLDIITKKGKGEGRPRK